VISKEAFFDGIGFTSNIDQLKLRGSWGQLGNQTAGDFTQLSLFGSNPNSGDYDIAGTNTGVEQGFVVLSRGNPNVTWETTTQSNIGLNLSMFNGKISLLNLEPTKIILTNSVLMFLLEMKVNPTSKQVMGLPE